MATKQTTKKKPAKKKAVKTQKTFLVLGGYGNAGRFISTYLLGDERANVIIAGRHVERAGDLAARLCKKFGEGRAVARYADVMDKSSLLIAMEGVDMVVVAAPVIGQLDTVLSAAVEVGIDYCDILMASPDKYKVLDSYLDDIKTKNMTVITDSGVHPGMAAPLVRMMAGMFATPKRADVAACFRVNWKSLPFNPVSASEFASELRHFNPSFYHNGKWLKAKPTAKPPLYDFGSFFGKQRCMPMMLTEMRVLPKEFPTMKHTGFYISGFNGISDAVVMPICFELIKRFPKAKKLHDMLGKLFFWSLKRFSKPPFGTIIQVNGSGFNQSGKDKHVCLRVYHDDAYALTGASTVACLFEYLDGNFEDLRGEIHLQGNIVNPDGFIQTLQDMGAHAGVVKG